jgi:O-antigen/teichoic acid export membrane protein
MRTELKALSRETLIYGLSTVIGRFLNFLLVPFYVNVLHSTAEYGITTSLYTYLGFLNVIYPLGLEAAFFRYGARAEGETFDLAREKRVFSTPFLFIVVAATLFSALILMLAPWAVGPVFRDPSIDLTPMIPTLIDILRLGALILFFDSLALLPFAVLRLEHQAWRFAGIRLVGIVVTLILNFILVMGWGWGVKGIFVANLTASILVVVLLLPTISARLTFRIDFTLLKKVLPFGLTNVPAYLSSMMVQVIDRPIVQAFLGLGVLGVYQANYRMGFVMMVFVSLFEYAWRPFFMRQSLRDDASARILFSEVFTYFMTLALIAFLALSFWLPTLVSTTVGGRSLLSPSYWSGLPIIPVVLLAYVFQGMYTNFIAGIYIKEKNKVLPLITGLGAVINIALNLILIPRIGMMGAALATLFAYMAMALAIYRTAQKYYFVPYEWARVGTLSLIVGISFFTERLVSPRMFVNEPTQTIFFQMVLVGVSLGAAVCLVKPHLIYKLRGMEQPGSSRGS